MKRRVTVALKRARADSDRSVLIGVSVGKEWLTTRNPERPSVSLSAFRAAESYKKKVRDLYVLSWGIWKFTIYHRWER